MSSDLSNDINPPPLTLQDCLINSTFNLARYCYYRRRLDNQTQSFERNNVSRRKKRKCQNDASSSPAKSRSRSVKRHKALVRDVYGHMCEVRPEDILWYLLYVAQPPMCQRMNKLFRLRFRLPYASFEVLADNIDNYHLFERWTRTDATGEKPSNMKLLLLGFMRYMGRAWSLDDLSESNGISVDVNRDFLKCFIEYGTTFMYKKYVLDPAS